MNFSTACGQYYVVNNYFALSSSSRLGTLRVQLATGYAGLASEWLQNAIKKCVGLSQCNKINMNCEGVYLVGLMVVTALRRVYEEN